MRRELYLWMVKPEEVPRGASQRDGTEATTNFMYDLGRAAERNGIDMAFEAMDVRVLRIRTTDTGYTMLRLLYGERFTVWPRQDNHGPSTPFSPPPPPLTRTARLKQRLAAWKFW